MKDVNSIHTVVPRIQIQNITKQYGGIIALDDISFSIFPGEIHALVGENGAGKSTLVKIITGLETANSGSYYLDGNVIRFSNPMEARKSGIVAVYQDPKLFPNLDIAENVFMGMHPVNKGHAVAWQKMYSKTKQILEWLGSSLDPKALVATLSIAEMQYVEFARAMFDGDEKVLILDEPTSSLTPIEAEQLFKIVNKLKERKASILFISHRIEELFGFADRVTILRDGKYVNTNLMTNVTKDEIIRDMVGRSLANLSSYPKSISNKCPSQKEEILRVDHLTSSGEFYDISFSVYSGEIVGIAGLVGAGRTEVAKAIIGDVPITSGTILVNGKVVIPNSPSTMIDSGIVYVPEDRETEGLISNLSVTRNLALPSINKFSKHGFSDTQLEYNFYHESVKRYQIKSSSPSVPVSSLSGGNRQKVVLAKWMSTNPKVMILDEPTHGIDVGSKAQVHQIMLDLANEGIGILIISSDLPEILAVCDRILIMADGILVSEILRTEATQESVMFAATQHMKEEQDGQ